MKFHVSIAKHRDTKKYHIVLPVDGLDLWSKTIRKTMCGSIGRFETPFHNSELVNRLLHNEELCGECRYQYNKKIKDEVTRNERALQIVINCFLNCIYDPVADNVVDNVVDIMRRNSSR